MPNPAYIDPAGSNGAAGTAVAPWQTLKYLIDNMDAGGQGFMNNGSYVGGRNNMTGLKNGTVGSYTRIYALNIPAFSLYTMPTYNVTLTTPTSNDSIGFPSARQYIAMGGFRTVGNGPDTTGYGLRAGPPSPTVSTVGRDLLFEDIEIYLSGGSGIKPTMRNSIVRRTWVHHNGNATSHQCIYSGDPEINNLYEDIHCHNAGNHGVRDLQSGGMESGGHTFRRIISRDNPKAGFFMGEASTLHHFLSYNNGAGDHAGLTVWPGSGKIVNVSFGSLYNNGTSGGVESILLTGSGGVVLRNVMTLSNVAAAFSDSMTGSKTISNNIGWGAFPGGVAGDYWVDAPNDDFHLKDNANAAIGGGLAISGITSDLDNDPLATPPDIGAYALVATGGTPPVNEIPTTLMTQISVNISFNEFGIAHGGDLNKGILYAKEGSFDL